MAVSKPLSANPPPSRDVHPIINDRPGTRFTCPCPPLSARSGLSHRAELREAEVVERGVEVIDETAAAG